MRQGLRHVRVTGWADWRRTIAALLAARVPPETIHFTCGDESQLGLAMEDLSDSLLSSSGAASQRPLVLPPDFRRLAETVSCHLDRSRWSHLYHALWRLLEREPRLLRQHADPLVRRLRLMEQAVHRDMHKMRAFVRFRRTADGVFVGWYRPDHSIVRRNAPFFVRRFGTMTWSILTPDLCAYWDQQTLRFGPGVPEHTTPNEDAVEDLWLAYYASIFNPARVNVKVMTAEMPQRHWATLPEAKLIRPLVQTAGARVAGMIDHAPLSASTFIPADASWADLGQAVHSCQGCELFESATQGVFGEGPPTARIMLVGEQPGDQEDRVGRPFVGPAGQLLDRALVDAGLDRRTLYITNAVKHVHFEVRGRARKHKRPSASHIAACRPWITTELQRIQPKTIVCLGATAAQSLLGRSVRIDNERGRWLDNVWTERLLVTTHPSALLRMLRTSAFEQEYRRFVNELAMVHINEPEQSGPA